MSVTLTSFTKDINQGNIRHYYASTASTIYINASSLSKEAKGVDGIFAQASVAVSISSTMSPTDLAIDGSAESQAGVLWSTPVVLVASAITELKTPCTALKVVFPSAGELHIGIK